jgi:hypothetical protein
MKKVNDNDELREEYTAEDFPGGLVRGKYAQRLRESSNIVMLKPEVAEAFPTEEAVNDALLALMKIAQQTTRRKKSGRKRKIHTV